MLIIKQETWYIITTLGWADNIDLNLIYTSYYNFINIDFIYDHDMIGSFSINDVHVN